MLPSKIKRILKRAPRALRLTPTGRVLIALAFCAGLIALTTGNNLMFLGWSMVLASIIVSGILSELTLRSLSCLILPAPLLRAKSAATLQLSITNLSRFLPCFSFEVYADAVGRHGQKRIFSGHQLCLPAGQSVTLPVEVTMPMYGTYRIDAWCVMTAYPFGFFQKIRRFPTSAQILSCAPEQIDVQHYLQNIDQNTQQQGEHAVTSRGEDFDSLRLFRVGDDWRRIHWRRSARQGVPVVVEYAAAHRRMLLVRAELTHADRQKDAHTLAVLASLSESLLAQGWHIGVQCGGIDVPARAGPQQCALILEQLARDEVDAQNTSAWHGTWIPCVTLVADTVDVGHRHSSQLYIGEPI